MSDLEEYISASDNSSFFSCDDSSDDASDLNNCLSREFDKSLEQSNQLVSFDKFNELFNTLKTWQSEINLNLVSIRDEIKSSLTDIKTEIKTLRNEYDILKQSVSNINTEISCLQHSSQFQSDEHVTLKQRVDDLARATNERTSSLAVSLQSRIDSLEQQARQTNVEICNVPERKSENLVGIVEAIGTAIRFPISKGDLVSVHRVPHAHQASDKPKNIIVKFSTRIQRDNILASYRNIKSLRSDQLGIQGTPSTIYLNEHLTLQKKQLFRKTRETAKELHYKYVWIRNSTILIRENDDSPALAIRGDNDLSRLRSRNKK
ncbi:hypothetical protein ACJJTC_016844 [Scirpophaga incertulas]